MGAGHDDDLTAYDTSAASSVVHYFRADRPGQLRSISDITPALPLFAQLRRYTLATIAAAETAANLAAVIYTDSPANGEADPLEPMDEVELEQRMATVLPGGWKLGQVHAEQPTATFGEFKREILNEIARCLNMPFNVAAGNSSGYNYAGGRLARLDNRLAVGVKRNRPNLLTRGCIHQADERLAARRELDHKHGFARRRVHGDGGIAFRPNRKRQRIAASCTRKRGHDHAVQLTLRREDDCPLSRAATNSDGVGVDEPQSPWSRQPLHGGQGRDGQRPRERNTGEQKISSPPSRRSRRFAAHGQPPTVGFSGSAMIGQCCS